MSELEIKKRELDEKMTAIADGIRELSGDTALKGLDDMAQGAQTANAEIADQEELLAQVAVALENKVSGYERGKKEGFAEALAKRTDLVVTENGEYTPSEDSTGFKSVSVAVKSENKLVQVVSRTVTEITEDDLQGATEVGNHAFYYCDKLKKLALPNSVNRVKEYSFQWCTALEDVTIPFSVNYISNHAFSYCRNLKTFTIKATTPPSIQSNTFQNVPTDCVFTVPYGSGEAYKSATNWSALADKIIEGDV